MQPSSSDFPFARFSFVSRQSERGATVAIVQPQPAADQAKPRALALQHRLSLGSHDFLSSSYLLHIRQEALTLAFWGHPSVLHSVGIRRAQSPGTDALSLLLLLCLPARPSSPYPGLQCGFSPETFGAQSPPSQLCRWGPGSSQGNICLCGEANKSFLVLVCKETLAQDEACLSPDTFLNSPCFPTVS